jgi:hypothetical protein
VSASKASFEAYMICLMLSGNFGGRSTLAEPWKHWRLIATVLSKFSGKSICRFSICLHGTRPRAVSSASRRRKNVLLHSKISFGVSACYFTYMFSVKILMIFHRSRSAPSRARRIRFQACLASRSRGSIICCAL